MVGRTVMRQRLARFTTGTLVLGWAFASAAVHAAQASPDLIALPWLQIGLGCWIAAWGGAAATLTRYLASVYEDRPFLVKVEVAKDCLVSVIVGGMTYMTGALYQLDPSLVGMLLLLSGWLGVRLLNVAADRLLSAVVSKSPPAGG